MQHERPRFDKKVVELTGQVHDLALQKGPGARLPTTRELCLLLNTNSATLNRALEELEQRNVIYRKHKSGIFVSQKLHRKTICVLFFSRLFTSEALSPFWSILWTLYCQEMQERNLTRNEYYSFHLIPEPMYSQGQLMHEALPEHVLELFRTNRVHGVLSVGMEHEIYNWITRQGIPTVAFAGFGSAMISVYDESTIHLAISELLRLGSRKIGMWIPNLRMDEVLDTIMPYREWQNYLIASQMPVHRTLFHVGEPLLVKQMEGIYDFYKQGYQLAHTVFGASSTMRPDGLFITNDLMTSGALHALKELGVCVGKDVQIVSMANAGSPVLTGANADVLTLLEVNIYELVQKMFTFMEQALDEQQMPEKPRLYYLSPSLRHIERTMS